MDLTKPLPQSANAAWLRALTRTSGLDDQPNWTLPALVQKAAERQPDAPALLSRGENFTYGQLAARANAYAHWAAAHKIGPGSVVGLLMTNRPEFVAIWLGIAKTGGAVALLNTNLRGVALAHCAKAANVGVTIAEAPFADRVVAPASCWLHGDANLDWPRIDHWIAQAPASPVAATAKLKDRALYIYTSGTTGLPKAASISHRRIMQWSEWFAGIAGLGSNDRIYNCLPLYHSVGGLVGVGSALAAGGSVFLREKFSSSQFWPEVASSASTVFLYIGELCRYLLNAPVEQPAHGLRLALGNGLRKDIWEAFQSRFAIPQILEFYAATEGNFSLFNCEGQPGAIGRFPNFLPQRNDVALIAIDPETKLSVRGADGFMRKCNYDEVGEAISRIGSGGAQFEGYADAAATERKILRNIFANDDAWFSSGDLMRKDARGFYYFVDRIGETFRWKGENVSTAEVAAVVRACPNVLDADVYGVAVPGTEGKAAMAAIVVADGFGLDAFQLHLQEHLPAYACPIFARICRELSRTATFKSNTQILQEEGYNLSLVTDPLFFRAPGQDRFVPLNETLYQDLVQSRIRM